MIVIFPGAGTRAGGRSDGREDNKTGVTELSVQTGTGLEPAAGRVRLRRGRASRVVDARMPRSDEPEAACPETPRRESGPPVGRWRQLSGVTLGARLRCQIRNPAQCLARNLECRA